MISPRTSNRFRCVATFILSTVAIMVTSAFFPPARAQENAPPTENPTAKWLAEQDPQWQAAFQHDVKEAFDKGLADLNKQYLAGVENGFNQATRDGKLEEALIWRVERDRVAAAGAGPIRDDPGLPPIVETLRAPYRKSLAALEADRVDRAKKLFARYDAILGQSLIALTKAQRLDEALLIKAKREALSAAWLQGADKPPVANAPMPATPPSAPPVAQATPRLVFKPSAVSTRALVAKLLGMGADIRAPGQIKSVNDVTSDNLVVTSISFSKNMSTEGVAAVVGLNPETFSMRGESPGKLSLDGWDQLQGASRLKKVDLQGSPRPGFLSRLAKIPSLEDINMSVSNGAALKDAEIATLGTLPNLRHLRLALVPVTGAAFAKWPARNGALTTLQIPDSGNIDEASLQALLNTAPNLSELSVGSVSIDDAKIKILGQFAALKTFRLSKDTSPSAMKKLKEALPRTKVELRTDNRF